MKNSFTLFETILALTVISILIGGFLKTSNYSPSHNFNTIKNELLLGKSSNLETSTFGVFLNHSSQLNVILIEEGTFQKIVYKINNFFVI